jgi:hypothetical protein
MGIPMGKTVPFSLSIFSFIPMRQSLHKKTTNIAEDKMTASQSGGHSLSHGDAHNLQKNVPFKQNKYVIDKELQHTAEFILVKHL